MSTTPDRTADGLTQHLLLDFPPGDESDARTAYVDRYSHRMSLQRSINKYLRRERLDRLEFEQRLRYVTSRMPPPPLIPPSPIDLWSSVDDGQLRDRRRRRPRDDDDDLRLPFDA